MVASFVRVVARRRLLESFAAPTDIFFILWLATREENSTSSELNIYPEVSDVGTTPDPAEELAESVAIADSVHGAKLKSVQSVAAGRLLAADR